MKTSNKDIVEFVGIFAIVISLIFVGIQLSLERKVALAEQYFNRAESVKEDYRTALLNPEHFRSLEVDWAHNRVPFYSDRDWVEMKQVKEGMRRISSVETRWFEDRLQIVGYDNLYYQFKQGLIDEETWNALRENMKRSMSYSDMTRDVFESGARPNIKPIIEEILKELEFPSSENAKAFVNDPEIQPIFSIRHRSTISNLILVEGGDWRGNSVG